MKFFQTLLWWLLLAAFGALAWQLLSPDLGQVLIRWHGTTMTTTVAFLLLAWALLWFAAWMLWTLFRLPFTAWQRLAQSQARNRLLNGLAALHEGRHARAGSLLEKAAEEPAAATVARLAAREAALRRGDLESAASQQAALVVIDPLAAALNSAAASLEQGKPKLALEALQPWSERNNLPPRGLQLRGEALVASGRASESVVLIAALGREQAVSIEQLVALERRWQSAALAQAAHADELHQRWQQLTPRQREDAMQLRAFANRAGQLGLEADAAEALAVAIEREWSEALVVDYALLPAAREDNRLARAERWLPQHQDSPALALALGRLCLRAQQLGKASEVLHRAIAQGAGADAWEELGNVHTAQGDAARAQLCYANALRTSRGEPARPLSGRSLRDQIADEAVAEQRDEHGMPHLRS